MLEILGIVFGYGLFYFVMLAGILIIPFGLPGQFAIPTAVLGFILISGTNTLGWWVFFAVLGIAVLAEIIEAIAGFLGASSAKASIWSSFGALGGGIIGAVGGTMVIPIAGSLIGALAGTFAGAYVVEYYRTHLIRNAHKVAKGALIGRIVGSITKIVLAVIMVVLITILLYSG